MPATQNAATLEEAIQSAGSSVLGHLGSRAHKLTVEEVKEYEEDLGLIGQPKEGEHRVYAGPYTDPADVRNVWTGERDLNGASRVTDQLPEQQPAKQAKPAATTAAAQRPPEANKKS